jgi:hypothetical protein
VVLPGRSESPGREHRHISPRVTTAIGRLQPATGEGLEMPRDALLMVDRTALVPGKFFGAQAAWSSTDWRPRLPGASRQE